MVQRILPNIFRIPVRLKGNPLKILNSYVVKTTDRNLLIDTGFNQDESFEDLKKGIEELDLDMDKTDIFLTHFHSDHTGLVPRIAGTSSKKYMGAADIELFEAQNSDRDGYWGKVKDAFLSRAYPEDEYRAAVDRNPARHLVSPVRFDCIPVHDNEVLRIGDMEFVCIHTPGHTPGHFCLYNKKNKLIFLGDQLLFDITPNISVRPRPGNALKEYLESLQKLKNYDVAIPLTAHRENNGNYYARIDELIQHHDIRLQELIDIIKTNPGINGYQAAAKMEWSIRAKSWDDFPPGQKWFAVAEALAHVDYLIYMGKVSVENNNGIEQYSIAGGGV
ncbi:MAG: MBL fold metallo-hydrolase [Spirochaetaceae bacterium]|jgi:glyoxylase-like metal-dependent hydrolase (beta-lactamase superfamily II)|nr:MBL fold metallo-hydrolase [Spirochaetaceae bacterium]